MDVQLSALRAHPQNYNQHSEAQIGRLMASLEKFGQPKEIVVWRGLIIAGHGLVEAARRLGWTALRASDMSEVWTEAQALAYLGADNELARLADPDEAALAQLAASLRDVDAELAALAAGTEERLAELMATLDAPAGDDPGPQVDKASELQAKWQTATGQLWQLGEHRLICGDCTDAAVVERVLDGARAQLAVTSPPYGVGKSYETKGVAAWFETVRPCIRILCDKAAVVVWQIGDLYVTASQFIEPTLTYSINMFAECGFRVLWLRVWEKPGMNFGVGPYHLVSNKPVQQYEHVVALGSDEDAIEPSEPSDYEWIVGLAGPKYRFVKRLTRKERREWGYAGVWRIATVSANDSHPAMFPLELPERCIRMHSDPGQIVLEPFSGSGTTLIACERLGRRCRAVEIDPGYVAVALERWATMTGRTPVLVEPAAAAHDAPGDDEDGDGDEER